MRIITGENFLKNVILCFLNGQAPDLRVPNVAAVGRDLLWVNSFLSIAFKSPDRCERSLQGETVKKKLNNIYWLRLGNQVWIVWNNVLEVMVINEQSDYLMEQLDTSFDSAFYR